MRGSVVPLRHRSRPMHFEPHANILHRRQAFVQIVRLEDKAEPPALRHQDILRRPMQLLAKKHDAPVFHASQTPHQRQQRRLS